MSAPAGIGTELDVISMDNDRGGSARRLGGEAQVIHDDIIHVFVPIYRLGLTRSFETYLAPCQAPLRSRFALQVSSRGLPIPLRSSPRRTKLRARADEEDGFLFYQEPASPGTVARIAQPDSRNRRALRLAEKGHRPNGRGSAILRPSHAMIPAIQNGNISASAKRLTVMSNAS